MLTANFSILLRFCRAPWDFLARRKLLALSLIPYAIGLISFLVFFILGLGFRHEIGAFIFQSSSGWIQVLIDWLLAPALVVLGSTLLAFIFMSTLGAFFLDSIILTVFEEQGLRPKAVQSMHDFLTSTFRSLKDNLVRLLYLVPVLLLSLAVSFLPPLYIFPALLAAFLVGFDLVDTCLSLLELPFKKRLRIIFEHKLEILTIGTIMSLLLLIPFGGVLFLPFAYYATAKTLTGWPIDVIES